MSKSVQEIFKRHTDLIEPLSLDEAYLDVTENKTGLPTATLVARTIREQIRQELNLTASAGVAKNESWQSWPLTGESPMEVRNPARRGRHVSASIIHWTTARSRESH